MDEEEKLLTARFNDLAERSYKNNIFTYIGFLSASEQDCFLRQEDRLKYASPVLFGGSELCERKVLRFGSQEQFGYSENWPIKSLLIAPLMQKYSDNPEHRDFLGAVLNLGIERQTVGDILIRPDMAVLFCLDSVADTIKNELTRVSHTSVSVREIGHEELDSVGFKPVFTKIRDSVASLRADAVLAAACNMSRSRIAELIAAELVTVNGRILHKAETNLRPGDIFTVRGSGKYIYDGEEGTSRKGRLWINVRKYS